MQQSCTRGRTIPIGLCLTSIGALLLAGIVHCRRPIERDSSAIRSDYYDAGDDDYITKRRESTTTGQDEDNRKGATCEYRSICGKAPLNYLTKTRRRGKLSASMTQFMVNGEAQTYGEWPSFVKLRLSQYNSASSRYKMQECGGVLVSDRHILTAAHCLLNQEGGLFKPKNIVVTFGDHRIYKWDQHEHTSRVVSICSASGFSITEINDRMNVYNDTAVLTLKDKIEFGHYYQPACLPYKYINTTDTYKTPCYVIGIGVMGFIGGVMPILPTKVMKMQVRHVPCDRYGFDADDTRECFTKAHSRGNSCNGDSGGPVLCLEPESKRWTVVGTVSYGPQGCSGRSQEDWTFVAARIAILLPSIKQECGI